METGITKLTPELLAMIGTGGVKALTPFTREIFLLDIVIAGTTFCENMDELEPDLIPDTVLKMIRDPKNKHDELAIGIYYQETRIGWVPRELNEVISRLMDAGKAFFGRIVKTRKINAWLKINAAIFMVE
ncbi:MAG: HIRAN domain-containing protein [Paludibacteraceae bacterium]